MVTFLYYIVVITGALTLAKWFARLIKKVDK